MFHDYLFTVHEAFHGSDVYYNLTLWQSDRILAHEIWQTLKERVGVVEIACSTRAKPSDDWLLDRNLCFSEPR